MTLFLYGAIKPLNIGYPSLGIFSSKNPIQELLSLDPPNSFCSSVYFRSFTALHMGFPIFLILIHQKTLLYILTPAKTQIPPDQTSSLQTDILPSRNS